MRFKLKLTNPTYCRLWAVRRVDMHKWDYFSCRTILVLINDGKIEVISIHRS
jgi:hypothetical protein